MRSFHIRNRVLCLTADTPERFLPASADEIYRAFVEHERVWADVDLTAPLEITSFSRYPLSVRLVLKLQPNTGLPELEAEGYFEDLRIALAPEELAAGHAVAGETWFPLDPGTTTDVSEILKGISIHPGPVRSLRALMALRQRAIAGGPIVDLVEGTQLSPLAFVSQADGAPTGVNANLYAYQTSGWRWLRFLLSEHVGGLLADEMGLGKTLQIISVISDPGENGLGRVLIVAPGSLLENWCREMKKFAPHLRVLKHHGNTRTGRAAELKEYDVVVTSYDTVVRDNSMLNMLDWGAVVIDEAQYIRNPAAQRTRSVKRLKRRVGLAVTGTPVENSLKDLWSIVDFALPGYLGDEKEFDRRFPSDGDGAAKVEPLVSPIMLRRRVSEVAADLLPRIDIPQVLELDAAEAELYDQIRSDISAKYGATATLVSLINLRQFCCHPCLLESAQHNNIGSFTKFERLSELLEEIFAANEKVIIFTSFTEMADLIVGMVRSRFSAFAGCIDGRLAIDERQPLIDRFSDTVGSAALILNPRAGGAGLNITAANHVIHYNLEWNPALEDQASARAYRRGQTRTVTVHRLFFAGTVEEVVNDRLTRKRDLSTTAVVGVEGKDEDYADILAALNKSPLKSTG